MEAEIVRTTELRSKTAKILEGLRSGESYILIHYQDVVGFITPDIPEEILKKLGDKKTKIKR